MPTKIAQKDLTTEIARPAQTGLRSVWQWRPLASMTPAQVADVLRLVDGSVEGQEVPPYRFILHQPPLAAGIEPQTAEVMVRPGLLRGPKATRHADDGNALPDEQWRGLPGLWRRAIALLLDTKSGKPLWLLPGADGRTPQLAVEVDFVTGRPKRVTNAAVSAYTVTLAEMKNRLKAGSVKVLWGSLE